MSKNPKTLGYMVAGKEWPSAGLAACYLLLLQLAAEQREEKRSQAIKSEALNGSQADG